MFCFDWMNWSIISTICIELRAVGSLTWYNVARTCEAHFHQRARLNNTEMSGHLTHRLWQMLIFLFPFLLSVQRHRLFFSSPSAFHFLVPSEDPRAEGPTGPGSPPKPYKVLPGSAQVGLNQNLPKASPLLPCLFFSWTPSQPTKPGIYDRKPKCPSGVHKSNDIINRTLGHRRIRHKRREKQEKEICLSGNYLLLAPNCTSAVCNKVEVSSLRLLIPALFPSFDT